LGCYGYHRNTSPTIDWIASEGVRFNEYYTSDAPCLPSRSAMMSGMFGIHNGAVSHGGHHAEVRNQGASRGFVNHYGENALPAVLKNAGGLHTALIGGFAERHSTFNYYAGFKEIHDTGMGGMESAEHVTPTALKWIDQNAEDDDWYLHINYWDPHTPYRAPEEFGNPFEDEPMVDFYNEELIAKHRQCPGPHTAQDIYMWDGEDRPQYPRQPGQIKDMESMKKIIDGYDCGIAYMDSHIAQLMEALKAKGVLDDLIIIVSADHGENFGELGLYAEHATADVTTCKIPMIIRYPEKGLKNHVVEKKHYNVDLLPTYCEMLGEDPNPLYDGKSFLSTLTSGKESGREEVVLSQMAHVCQRSVRWDNWLYMRTWHDGMHLFPREMLFNIKEDPYEQNDVSLQHPDILNEGARRLFNWTDEQLTNMPWEAMGDDPLWTILKEGGPLHSKINLEQRCQQLKETGRSEHIKETMRRHGPQPRD
jgi:arylsulfatase A-like enzyme